ncbi:hypothetical protein SDJN03_19180, partial [Cucurbita argyrosperma subsp. sororia]
MMLRLNRFLAGAHMSGLEEFYVSMNEVAEMEELGHFQQLRILELGSTRPQYCVASEGHYLSQNGVSELEGISTLGDIWLLRWIDVCSLEDLCLKTAK